MSHGNKLIFIWVITMSNKEMESFVIYQWVIHETLKNATNSISGHEFNVI